MSIEMSPRRILSVLLSIIGALVVANLAGLVSKYALNHDYAFGLVPLFDFDTESNLPTFYSSLQLIVAAALLALIGARHRSSGDRHIAWFALAVIFAYLAVDETAGFHEATAVPVRTKLEVTGLLYFAWVIPYSIAVLLFLMVFSRFIFGLPRETLRWFLLCGAMFVFGAIGLELLGAREFETHGEKTLLFASLYTIEETFEMTGIALFIYSLLAYISNTFGYVRWTIGN